MSKTLLFFLMLALCFLGARPASAGGEIQIFPPLNQSACNASGNEYLSWNQGLTGTMCVSGQQILKNAMPNCADGQAAVSYGGQFYCKTPSLLVDNLSASNGYNCGFKQTCSAAATITCPNGGTLMSSSGYCNYTYWTYNGWLSGGYSQHSGTVNNVACTWNAAHTSCTVSCGGSGFAWQSFASATCIRMVWQ